MIDPRILTNPDEVMATLGTLNERTKSLIESAEYTKNAIHSVKNSLQDHATRLTVAESHIEECKAERKVANQIHDVVRTLSGRIEKGEDRDTLLDKRALKIEDSVESIKTSIQSNETRLLELKFAVDSLKNNWSSVSGKGWQIIQALGLAYLSFRLGWAH